MIKILELFGGLKVEVYSDGRVKSLDSKGIRKNGTMYHQAGNSIVVDVLEAIFEQLL